MMKNVIIQICSFILPVTALVIVPLWIEKSLSVHTTVHFFAGVIIMVAGLITMTITIISFIKIGKGTLAPWSPTGKLVIKGLYKYVRNPMILGAFTVLLGEALALHSNNILEWSGAFFLINTFYFIIYEEPNLEKRFGDDYRDYKKHVPRWLPRFSPYHPEQIIEA